MTYRNARRLIETGGTLASALAFLAVPFIAATGDLPVLWTLPLAAIAFIGLYHGRTRLVAGLDSQVRRRIFRKPETRVVLDFAARIGQAFTILDLVDAIRENLEKPADMGAEIGRAHV